MECSFEMGEKTPLVVSFILLLMVYYSNSESLLEDIAASLAVFFFFFFFLDLLKEVESSLRTNRDCLASLKCRTPCQNRHDYRLNHPPRKTRPKTT